MTKEKKPKLPFYRKWWFIVLVIIAVIVVWSNTIGKKIDESADEASKNAAASRDYIETTVDQLYEELDDNPLKAKDTYTDTYVAVKGQMRVIDSDGESVSIYPLEYDSLDGIYCTLSSDEQREAVKAHRKGDAVTVKGIITEVDGIFPYKIYVDSIE